MSESIIKRIIQNPIIQAFVIYVSGGWIILEITEYFIENFGLNERARIILLVILLCVLPFVIFFSWNLSRKQRERDRKEEMDSPGARIRVPEDRLLRIVHLLRKPGIYLPGLLLLIAILVSIVFRTRQQSRIRWAKEEAIPAIFQAVEESDNETAFKMANRANRFIPGDSILINLWPRFSYRISIHSDPSGAEVYWKSYTSQEENWNFMGETPLDSIWFPNSWCGLSLEKEDYEPMYAGNYSSDLEFQLFRKEESIPGMVFIQSGSYNIRIPGLEHLGPVKVEGYWMDKYEVTNKKFQEFVDAGGYQDPRYWTHEFVKDGISMTWEEAMNEFLDATGRMGPSTWEMGAYPEGLGEYPVSGISWYEAEAYAEFAHKSLPSIFHWNIAANPLLSSAIVPLSNYSGHGPAPVGSFKGMSMFGTYDMAGNAREWCWNEGMNQRFILGGGWNDPNYTFQDDFTQAPFNRYETNGFRCVMYIAKDEDRSSLLRSIDYPYRDFMTEQPISEEIREVYKKMFEYDRTDLEAEVVSVEQSESGYIKEEITFNAAYNNERATAFLLLPEKGNPPYQVVVYFPGSNALQTRSNENMEFRYIDFMLKSGRAVMFPVYKSTYERGDGLASTRPDSTNNYKDHVIMWSNDLGRSIDYLETRSDINTDKLAYFGFSWGGRLGVLLVAVESRFKACILNVAGLKFQRSLPDVDPFNYTSMVRIPTLMLNGRYDHSFLYETSQVPLYKLLGTPSEHKLHIVYETGHSVPRNQLIKESFDWLDRYLGPVN